jgi:hypothetical protein
VIGGLLDRDIAGLQVHRFVIEHHVDLARHDDGVVDGAGAVHQRMSDRNAPRRCMIADDIHHRVRRYFCFRCGVERRKLDDPEGCAILGWIESGLFFRAIVRERKTGWCRIRRP